MTQDSDPTLRASTAPAAEIVSTPATATPAANVLDNLSHDLDLVDQVVGHRLQQTDLKRILGQLSASDQERFTEKLADILRKTSALLEVSRRVSDSLSLDVLLPRMVELISEFLESERCTIFLLDRVTMELYSRVAQGAGIGEIRFAAHLGIAGAVFSSTEAVLVPDAYADPRFNQEIDRKTGYRTRNILCAPIRTASGAVIGCAQVLNKREGDFTQGDLRLLESITQQAASAFVNAQLHEEIERARHEETQLLAVTTAISRELHLQPLLQKIMETVTVILEADRSTLFMYDPKTKDLWSKVAQGEGLSEIRFPSHLGIAGSSFTEKETINIPDAYADPRFNPAIDKKTGYKTNTILCMPVLNKQGEAIGITQVLNRKGGPFTKIDEERLRAFSAQAAVAIENAQLFEEVVTVKNYNEAILQSMSNGVITLDAEGTLRTANHAALRLFRAERQPEIIVGRSLAEFFVDKNIWIQESVARVAKSGKPDVAMDVDLWLRQGQATVENERRRAKASVNVSTVPLADGRGASFGCLLLIEDITNEKRLRGTVSRYMPKAVADKLMEEGEAALGGQLQKATVLFTDIRSFTTISERLGPQETVKLLNEYFSIMVDILLAHGGILDKYIGDAMMAVFGAPFAGPEDADNAVRTAIGMIRALHAFNVIRVERGLDAVHMGVGINTDEVLSGNIGSLKRMDYTVIGDGVNLASRLEGANKHYGSEILISELTRRELKGKYRLREVDIMRVKGKTQPVSVFEVMDALAIDHMQDVLATYACAVDYYRRRDFDKAHKIFEEVLLIQPKDAVSEMYKERCRHFMETPPAADWDGVWTMKSK